MPFDHFGWVGVAVLPFENATGGSTNQDLELAFPSLVRRCLGLAEHLSVPRWDAVQSQLQSCGWTRGTPLNAAVAAQVAAEIRTHCVVRGSLHRDERGWVAEAVLEPACQHEPAEAIRVSAPDWIRLAEDLSRAVSIRLARIISEDDWERWHYDTAGLEAGAGVLAHALTLEATDAPLEDQRQAWMALMQAVPGSPLAYGSLLVVMQSYAWNPDARELANEFVQKHPGLCQAHVGLAHSKIVQCFDMAGAEAELREAMRLHMGCPAACGLLHWVLSGGNRSHELVQLLGNAQAARPGDLTTRVFLANALAQARQKRATVQCLLAFDDIPGYGDGLDVALAQAACWVGFVDKAGPALRRLGLHAAGNEYIRDALACIDTAWIRVPERLHSQPVIRPRSLSPNALARELETRLTPEERMLAVNPLAVTPELVTEAKQLTTGLTDPFVRAIVLYSEVARRGRGAGDLAVRTAHEALLDSQGDQARLTCHEHAQLFVALARALDLEAYLVHVERLIDGGQGFHDCAALFVGGQGLLVDPMGFGFGIPHREFSVLDDSQAISHQMMQLTPKATPETLRIGLKLCPNDRWTQLQYVRGMASAGELAAAETELEKVKRNGEEGWDILEATGRLYIARKNWTLALGSLRRALDLSPDNVAVHSLLATVYLGLDEPEKAKEHVKQALRLDQGQLSADYRQETSESLQVEEAWSRAQSGDPQVRRQLVNEAEAGSFGAQLALARVCVGASPPRVEEGLRWLLMAAKQGPAQAQFMYGRILLPLYGKEHAAEACDWLGKASSQGLADAQHLLALVLYEGNYVPRDNITAAAWATLAARHGQPDAIHLLKEMELLLDPAELSQAHKLAGRLETNSGSRPALLDSKPAPTPPQQASEPNTP